MRGAAILAATAIVSKIISGLYKIPLLSMLDDETAGYFQIAYTVYMLLIAISTAGIPVALSRMVSSANALGDRKLPGGILTWLCRHLRCLASCCR